MQQRLHHAQSVLCALCDLVRYPLLSCEELEHDMCTALDAAMVLSMQAPASPAAASVVGSVLRVLIAMPAGFTQEKGTSAQGCGGGKGGASSLLDRMQDHDSEVPLSQQLEQRLNSAVQGDENDAEDGSGMRRQHADHAAQAPAGAYCRQLLGGLLTSLAGLEEESGCGLAAANCSGLEAAVSLYFRAEVRGAVVMSC